jgi:hypothetical protein
MVHEGVKANKISKNQCEQLASMYDKINVFFQESVMLDDANHVMLLNL